MTKPNDVFDGIFCLTIPRREERWLQTKERCQREGITVEKYYGLDGDEFSVLEDYEKFRMTNLHTIVSRPSQYAILRSYINLFEHIATNGYKQVLLFQDDVTFHKDFAEHFDNISKMIPRDWDMVYLGATVPSNYAKPSYSAYILPAHKLDGLFAVAVNGKFVPRILQVLKGMYYPDDSAIKIVLQNKDNKIYVTNPLLCGHDYGWSDNYKRNFTPENTVNGYPGRYYNPEVYR